MALKKAIDITESRTRCYLPSNTSARFAASQSHLFKEQHLSLSSRCLATTEYSEQKFKIVIVFFQSK